MTVPKTKLTRDFTATAFVVWRQQVMLHQHKKMNIWLPCGGHIDANELPDEAAVREVYEESGVEIELVGERALPIDDPYQLIRPRGVQLEQIYPGHEHIDLIYFATPVRSYDGYLLEADPSLGWFDIKRLKELELTTEIRYWTMLALNELAAY